MFKQQSNEWSFNRKNFMRPSPCLKKKKNQCFFQRLLTMGWAGTMCGAHSCLNEGGT